jgi:hypothetical protein
VIKLRETDEYAREYSEIWHVLGEEFELASVQPKASRSGLGEPQPKARRADT